MPYNATISFSIKLIEISSPFMNQGLSKTIQNVLIPKVKHETWHFTLLAHFMDEK